MFQCLLFSTRKAVQVGGYFLLRAVRTFLTPNEPGSNASILALAAICGLLLSAVFAYGTPTAFAYGLPKVPAANGHPPYAESYYVTSTSTSTAYNHGCSQGKADAYWKSSSMAVLDFGAQISGSQVDNWDAGHISNAQVEAVAEAFANGYWSCTGSDSTTILQLAIGTNNSIASGVSSSTGKAWAGVAAAVQSYDQSKGYASQVIAMGGNDIEPSWGGTNSWSPAEAWASGYSNAGSHTLYTNFGSADGCPTSSSNDDACNNGWHQYGLWDVSWGASAAVATPQIYSNTMAWQWQKISLYGTQHQSKGAIGFWGPMSTPSLISTTTAWNDFSSALNSNSNTATSMSFLLQIDWTW